MRIAWSKGWWVILDMRTGEILGRFRRVRIDVPCELVNLSGDRHGWLVTAGNLREDGETAIIEKR